MPLHLCTRTSTTVSINQPILHVFSFNKVFYTVVVYSFEFRTFQRKEKRMPKNQTSINNTNR